MVSALTLGPYFIFLGLTFLERMWELQLSRRNARKAFENGGKEVGQGHFPFMVFFHISFLIACAVEPLALNRSFPGLLGWISLAGAIAAQGLRYWAISTLGERWNTRVIFVPGSKPVTTGPYRFVRHPNYVAVIMEFLFLPLIHGGYLTAIIYSLGNAALLYVRIRAEEQALGAEYQQVFNDRPRFIPGGSRETH
jgi:methyltransferase